MKEARVFETANLDLAAFLMLQGLEYMDCRVSFDEKQKKPKAVMRFKDLKQNARDLERIFINSNEKRYRDLTKYLLKEVHRAVNKFSEEIIKEQDEG